MNGTTLQAQGMTTGQKRDIRGLQNAALDELGLNKDQAQKLYGKGGALKAGIKELIQKLISTDLLEYVGTAELPAVDSFDVAANFKLDRNGEVPIGYIGENFDRLFIKTRRVEESVPAASLRNFTLKQASTDPPIISDLGGNEVVTNFLAHMFEMMRRQAHGEEGVLLTNGWANIFYIPDDEGTLWAVNCRWYSGRRYWGVEAAPVSDPNEWLADRQVVSR